MNHQQIIEHYGGENAAAEELGVTRQIVNYWKHHGVPIRTQALIQLLTKGKLKADTAPKQRAA